jgi:hypothetical protein
MGIRSLQRRMLGHERQAKIRHSDLVDGASRGLEALLEALGEVMRFEKSNGWQG